jgi:RAD51-like protein 3
VDTHGSCVADRLLTLLQTQTPDVDAAARRISVVTVTDIFQMFRVLEEHRQLLAVRKDAAGDMAGDDPRAVFRGGVIILDSISALVSPILGGGQVWGHALMMTLSSELKRLAQEYQAAVLVTNSYVGSRNNGVGQPGLGHSWLSAPHLRLDLAALFE